MQHALIKLSPEEKSSNSYSFERFSGNSIQRQRTGKERTSFGKEGLNSTGPEACGR
jgi:hypothetical protein